MKRTTALAILGRVLIYLVGIPLALFALFPDSLAVLKLWRAGALDPGLRSAAPQPAAPADAGGGSAPYSARVADAERLLTRLRPCTDGDSELPEVPEAAVNLLVLVCSDDGPVAMGPFDRPWVYARTISGWAHTKVLLAAGARGFDRVELVARDDGGEELRLSRPLAADYRVVIDRAPDGKPPRYGYVCDPVCAEDEPVVFIDLRAAMR